MEAGEARLLHCRSGESAESSIDGFDVDRAVSAELESIAVGSSGVEASKWSKLVLVGFLMQPTSQTTREAHVNLPLPAMGDR